MQSHGEMFRAMESRGAIESRVEPWSHEEPLRAAKSRGEPWGAGVSHGEPWRAVESRGEPWSRGERT